MHLRLKPLIGGFVATLLVAVIGLGSFIGYLFVSGNFHPVIAHSLYRSAQPSPGDIAKYSVRYGIKTIVNLRGAHPGRRWYDEEIASSRKYGIRHLDFHMSAKRPLSRARAAKLVDILKKAEKPVWIHCRRGADRSGLVSAIFVAAVAGDGEARAESQLSFRYGHVGIPYVSPTYAMDETWENLEPWLGFHGS